MDIQKPPRALANALTLPFDRWRICFRLRSIFQYVLKCRNVTASSTSIVWTYATGLELNSPRFSQPGDFFMYVAFVTSIILVSFPMHKIFFHISHWQPRNICPLSPSFSCDGSWKRGILPLRQLRIQHSQNSVKNLFASWAWWRPLENKLA